MIKHKQKQQNCPCDDSGFTIIESLVAIIVVAILLVAIAPAIVMSTATRVQARRVELATRAAKTYIDGVRTGVIPAPQQINPVLDPPSTTLNRNLVNTPSDYLIYTKMPVPTSASDPDLYCFTKDAIITVGVCANQDKLLGFYIQARRIVQSTTASDGYRLGIRVYRADVDFSKPLTASTSTTKNTQRTFTNGIGDRQSPLIEMTTDIASTNTSFKALCQRLGVATNKACE
ncbi:type II secretion system protein [Nostocaceae cyanobacterium CENA369]|uniref:Type II secretion system protein n=1 Tax=Dendronalium phyllosphericum CENA369 TaxID=1725256 RepID=A0A8J7I1B1_9NOST|nr:hormogonium polysaccharide secretion pseudopilin HpsB [Dendronalium phyllosphericum]MBH8574214.1 type II secretion system protein [Dendronalium phyllosphericum CENA369]